MNIAKSLLLTAAVGASFLTGCATPQQKLEARKKEKYSAYSALPAEQRVEVDKGQIGVGMPMDAVYIAWGKPDQVVTGATTGGSFATWTYLGVYLQSYFVGPGWYGAPACTVRPYYYHPGPYIDYYPVAYPRSEVTFENGEVKFWRTQPSAIR